MRRVLQELLHPRLAAVVRREVVVDEKLAQHEPDPEVGERAKGEQPPRRVDQRLDRRIVVMHPLDDAEDGFVEREPDVLDVAHGREG